MKLLNPLARAYIYLHLGKDGLLEQCQHIYVLCALLCVGHVYRCVCGRYCSGMYCHLLVSSLFFLFCLFLLVWERVCSLLKVLESLWFPCKVTAGTL